MEGSGAFFYDVDIEGPQLRYLNARISEWKHRKCLDFQVRQQSIRVRAVGARFLPGSTRKLGLYRHDMILGQPATMIRPSRGNRILDAVSRPPESRSPGPSHGPIRVDGQSESPKLSSQGLGQERADPVGQSLPHPTRPCRAAPTRRRHRATLAPGPRPHRAVAGAGEPERLCAAADGAPPHSPAIRDSVHAPAAAAAAAIAQPVGLGRRIARRAVIGSAESPVGLVVTGREGEGLRRELEGGWLVRG
jgi:hypothetical protein